MCDGCCLVYVVLILFGDDQGFFVFVFQCLFDYCIYCWGYVLQVVVDQDCGIVVYLLVQFVQVCLQLVLYVVMFIVVVIEYCIQVLDVFGLMLGDEFIVKEEIMGLGMFVEQQLVVLCVGIDVGVQMCV